MGLLSEIDWMILLGVGALLLLGPQSGGVLRRLGQLYGRLLHVKDELVGEVSAAAGLPRGASAGGSIRNALLGVAASSPSAGMKPAIPMAIASAPGTSLSTVAVRLDPVATSVAVAGLGPGSWSWATPPTQRLPVAGEEGGS